MPCHALFNSFGINPKSTRSNTFETQLKFRYENVCHIIVMLLEMYPIIISYTKMHAFDYSLRERQPSFINRLVRRGKGRFQIPCFYAGN